MQAKESEDVMLFLCRLYEPLLRSYAGRYPWWMREDLMQEGRLVIVEAVRRFGFGAYLKKSIERRFKRYADRQKEYGWSGKGKGHIA